MAVLLDTCVWIEYFISSQKGIRAKEIIEGGELIFVSTINIAEIRRHFLSENAQLADKVTNFVLARAVSIPVGNDTAILAAKLKHDNKMTLGDSLILATALIFSSRLLTFDSDFEGIEGCDVL